MKLEMQKKIQRGDIEFLFLFSRVNIFTCSFFGYKSDKRIGHTRVGMQLKRNMENWLGNVWKFYSCDDNLAWLREFPQVSLNYFIVQSTHVLQTFLSLLADKYSVYQLGKKWNYIFLPFSTMRYFSQEQNFFLSIFNRGKKKRGMQFILQFDCI